jgi:hypothetical protein
VARLSLNVGSNTVDVRVTAQDGTTQKTYTSTVTRMTVPTLTSPTKTGITSTGATLGGNVTADGGATITERGVVYAETATNNNPTIGGTGCTDEITTGTTWHLHHRGDGPDDGDGLQLQGLRHQQPRHHLHNGGHLYHSLTCHGSHSRNSFASKPTSYTGLGLAYVGDTRGNAVVSAEQGLEVIPRARCR